MTTPIVASLRHSKRSKLVRQGWKKYLKDLGLHHQVRLGRYVEYPPEYWFIEDSVPAKHAPFLRVWTRPSSASSSSKSLLTTQEQTKIIERIQRKLDLGWLPSIEEQSMVRFIDRSLLPQALQSTSHSTRRLYISEYQAKQKNRSHDKLKWPIYNEMLLRHDELSNATNDNCQP